MLAIMKDDKRMVVTDYGKSMYGGWYANYHWEDAESIHFDGFHDKTLRGLCAQIGVSRTALQRDVRRWDT